MSHDEVLRWVRGQLDELAFLRMATPFDPERQRTYDGLCRRERELLVPV
jgi:hypothetical protein